MNRESRLDRAEAHIFSTGLRDGATQLCRANMKYGLAKLHWVQEQLGYKQDATFISTPDISITRNATRWKSGFGYGGKISWGEGDRELVVLDVKPNTCGMLVGGIDHLPDHQEMVKKIDQMRGRPEELDGIPIEWDFHCSNHFIDLFWVKPLCDIHFPQYAFIIHSSARELTGDNDAGMGLYVDKSKALQKMAEPWETPFGTLFILQGKKAREYYDYYCYAEEFGKLKRITAAERLFDSFEIISNEVHQGLVNMNEILLGSHLMRKSSPNQVFPFVLRGDLPAYLVRGRPSLTEHEIEVLGFTKRAKKMDVFHRLKKANIIPHGAGYTFPDLLDVTQVFEHNNHRYFEVDMNNDRGKKVLSEVREIPYHYRGREVVLKSLELKLCELVAKLLPRYILKT